MPRHFLGPWISGRWSFWQCQKWDFPFGVITVDFLSHSDLPGTAEARKYDAGGKMRFARGAGLWIFWCRMSMTLDIYFAGFCRGF